MASRDEEVAAAIADAADVFGAAADGHVRHRAREDLRRARAGFIWAEYYADLDYRDDGSMIITRQHEASDPAATAATCRARHRGGQRPR